MNCEYVGCDLPSMDTIFVIRRDPVSGLTGWTEKGFCEKHWNGAKKNGGRLAPPEIPCSPVTSASVLPAGIGEPVNAPLFLDTAPPKSTAKTDISALALPVVSVALVVGNAPAADASLVESATATNAPAVETTTTVATKRMTDGAEGQCSLTLTTPTDVSPPSQTGTAGIVAAKPAFSSEAGTHPIADGTFRVPREKRIFTSWIERSQPPEPEEILPGALEPVPTPAQELETPMPAKRDESDIREAELREILIDTLCRVKDCDSSPWCRGLCCKHYNKANRARNGELDRLGTPKAPVLTGATVAQVPLMNTDEPHLPPVGSMPATYEQLDTRVRQSLDVADPTDVDSRLPMSGADAFSDLQDVNAALNLARRQISELEASKRTAAELIADAEKRARDATAELECVRAEREMANNEVNHLEAALKDAENHAQKLQSLLDKQEVELNGYRIKDAAFRSLIDSAVDALALLDQLGIPQVGDLSQRIQLVAHLGMEAEIRMSALVESQHYSAKAHELRMRAQGLGDAVRRAA